MRRYFVAVVVALAALALAAPASATTVEITVTCTEVTFSYSRFPDGLTSSSAETVTVNGATVQSKQFSFTGPTATDVIPLSISGSATVGATANWTTPYRSGTKSTSKDVDCGDTTGGDTTGGDTTGGTTGGGTTGGTTGGGTTGTGGVIGSTTGGSSGGETGGALPFTGLPIWIPVLLAAGLLASGGLLLRRKRDDAS
jgi:hypothetical protein